MTNISEAEAKELCLQLMHADSEADVVRLLEAKGLWQDERVWRAFDDNPANFGSAGNQQNQSEQALVEKLVNSIDAKLMNEARLCGDILPDGSTSSDAPHSINTAKIKYFKELSRIKGSRKIIELSKNIAVVSTGDKLRPCFSIIDNGEGQSPLKMPTTILSLNRGNKSKIHFVQGKHNMGGTGALPYCSDEHNLQLVISKRNPKLLSEDSVSSDRHWGFTIVRLEPPSEEIKTSRYTYLAPLEDRESGDRRMILHFSSESLPIFPLRNEAYVRDSNWGTLIKLYEYDAQGFASMMMLPRGLRWRMNILLPEPALPIRFHECRDYSGKPGSYDTTMSGLIETLDEADRSAKRDNVIYHGKNRFSVDDHKFTAKFYVFKDRERAGAYRKNEAVVFTYNGQCHSSLGKAFFTRTSLGSLQYLKDEIIVFVDCSEIGIKAQEKLFMNSRDRFRKGGLYRNLIEKLEEDLSKDKELKRIANEKREERLRKTSKDESIKKSFEETMKNALKNLPDLKVLFKKGPKVPTRGRGDNTKKPFRGKRFPERFHFEGLEAGEDLVQSAPIAGRAKILFETDVQDDYFKRDESEDPGTFTLYQLIDGQQQPASKNFNYSYPSLSNGIAYLSLPVPENLSVGSSLKFIAKINDRTLIEPFTNKFTLRLIENKSPKRPPNPGSMGLSLPNVIDVHEENWEDFEFNEFTGMTVVRQPSEEKDKELYDYYFNMDNGYLRSAMARREKEAATVLRKFKLGITFVAMAVVAQETIQKKNPLVKEEKERENDIARRVALTTSAIAPLLLPIMEASNLFSPSDEVEEEEEEEG